jgi:hypothetical protein
MRNRTDVLSFMPFSQGTTILSSASAIDLSRVLRHEAIDGNTMPRRLRLSEFGA